MTVLSLPEPFDFELSTERFRAFGPDLANLWYEGGFHRVVGGRELRIEAAPGGVDIEPLDDETEPVARAVVGAAFELEPFYEWAQGVEVLRELVPRLAGFRPPLAPDPYETLVSAITAQQVSLFAAFAIRNRMVERFGVRGVHAYEFPTRERMAQASEEELTELGFSRRKAEYVLGVARAELDLEALHNLSDHDVKVTLTGLRGLGEWTADWFLARHLARPRAWPAGDLGLVKAMSAFFSGGRKLSIAEVREAGARFDPFQNLTAHYLLTGLRTAPPA
ncbi:MAG: DNA-3-methyladenine glycosylase 2 family protein [Actinobacteria bacterium]|nr:MAG: DNA-3-methyladenine glycosylase 2 family protein [Actinomycetota bacterium]